MNSGSNRYRASLVREDAYFAEIDQLLISNLREAIELQEEASRCATVVENTLVNHAKMLNRQLSLLNN